MGIRELLMLALVLAVSANQFKFGSSLIPHPDKVQKGGEDAFVTSQNLLIVADGVGGWNDLGIDAGKFSKALCSNAYSAWKSNEEYYSTRPQQLMVDSLRNNNNEGSSTMTIVTMDRTGRVHTANLGDSGYRWLRKQPNGQFKVLYSSPEQQHSFNFPYQLASSTSKHAKGDNPSSSRVKYHDPQHNDVFLLGTDGLFDNIFMGEILDILNRYGHYDRTGQMVNKDQIAKVLAQKAINYGKNNTYFSPFSAHAQQQGQSFVGGKLDDTTVIIAQVSLTSQNLRGSQSSLSDSRIGRAAASLFDNMSTENINRRIGNNLAGAFSRHQHLHS